MGIIIFIAAICILISLNILKFYTAICIRFCVPLFTTYNTNQKSKYASEFTFLTFLFEGLPPKRGYLNEKMSDTFRISEL